MYGIKDTSNKIRSIHSQIEDAVRQLLIFNDETLVVIEDTEENLFPSLE